MILKNTQPLLKVLKKQLEVCLKFLTIQKQKTDALIAGDIRQIDMLVRDEQSYIMKIESLEKQRDALLEQEKLSGLKVSDIITNHIEEDKEHFTDVSDKLLYVLLDLRKVNDLNQKLLRQRLSVIEHIVKISDTDSVRRA
jgi:flagellar biosynthesis/type III secretory pathway chaperone